MLQTNSKAKVLKPKNEYQTSQRYSNPMKRTYQYFVRHEATNDLRIQAKKRTDTRFFRFEGSLREPSNRRNQGKQTFNRLLSILQSSKAVSKLKLAITRFEFLTSRELFLLRKVFKKHSTLQSFHFEFDKFKTFPRPVHAIIDPDDLDDDFGGLRNHQLEDHLKSYYLETFYQNLKKLSSLQELSLTFGRNIVSDRALNALTSGMKKTNLLNNLNYQSIRERECFEIQILNGIKSDSQGPRNIRILFQDDPRDFYNLRALPTWTKNEFLWYLEGPQPSKTKGLQLTSGFDLTTQGLMQLNHTLEEKHSFAYLRIEFIHCQEFDEKQLKRLAANISKSTSLKRLELSFPSQSTLLKQHIQSLVKNIKLPWIFFRQSVGELNSFKLIDLSLSGQMISNTTLQAFSLRLRKLSSLESIRIKFSNRNHKKIGQIDEGLLALKQSLMQLFLLKKVTFIFSKYTLGQTEIQSLFQGLERLPSLTELNFKFLNCHIIGNWEVELLNEDIKDSPSLQIINFHFVGYKGVPPQGTNKLSKNLGRVKCDIVYES